MAISSHATGLRPGVCTSTTRPTNPYTGQIIYETDTGYLRVWDGSAWDYLSQSQNGTTNLPISDIGKAWTTFTVNWTGSGSNPAIGNGSMTGKYVKINKVVHGQILITMGSTTTYGSGVWFFDFPVAATNVFNYAIIGMAAFWDNSSSQNLIGFVVPNGTSTTKMQVGITGAGGTDVTSTTPFTWAVNDRFNLNFTYEAA